MAWNETKNRIFFERCKQWARLVQTAREDAQRLIDLARAEGIIGEVPPAEFVDQADATAGDALALMNLMFQFGLLLEDGTPTKANHLPVLAPFLADYGR